MPLETEKSPALIHLVADGNKSSCGEHLLDCFAMVYHHKMQYDRSRIGRRIDHTGPGAIRIYSVCSCARRPVLGWRVAAEDNVIDLCDMAAAIVVLQSESADGCVCV